MKGWRDILKKVHTDLLQQYVGKANGQEKDKLLSALALSNYLVKSLSGKDPDLKNILARSELKKSVLIYTPDDSFDQESNDVETEVLASPPPAGGGLRTGSFRDFRLRSLALKNFRKYPDGDLYGLCFHSDNNTPCSLILVGRNSHGKSSLYDAMEFVFTGNVSEAKLRNVDCTHFIAHGDTNLAPTIQARLVGSNEPVRSFAAFRELNPYSVRCCFCSEADTIEIGRREGNDRSVDGLDFFAENLGYGNLIAIKKGLAEVMHEEGEIDQNHTDIDNARRAAESARVDLNTFVESLFSLWGSSSTDGESIMMIRKELYKKVLVLIRKQDLCYQDVNTLLDTSLKEIHAYSDSLDFPVNKDFLENAYTRFMNELSGLRNQASDAIPKVLVPVDTQDIRLELRKILFALKVFIKRLTPYQFIDKGIVNEFEQKLQAKREKEDILRDSEEQVRSSRQFCGWKVYCQTLDDVLCRTLNDERMSILKPFVEKTMKMFIGADKEETIEITERLEIELKYREHGEMVTISPKRFYNTFRYKLFCMMLQVSTAVCFMKMHNFIFPVILDDIFYASDFGSRMLIRDFIIHFIQMYEKTIGKGRLQLICFTHDEIVLSAIYEALVKMNGNKINSRMDEFIFGRLVDYQALEPQKSLFTNLYVQLYKNKY